MPPVPVPEALLLAAALLVAAATALPLVPRPYWWVRVFDFPRLQIAAVALAVLALHAAYHFGGGAPGPWAWGVMGALALALLYQLAQVLPYTPLWPKQSVAVADGPEDRRLCLVVSNVSMQNRQADRWARVVLAERPSVVATVEVDAWWVERLRAALHAYPHRVEVPMPNTYGVALYSRLPLEDVEVKHLVEEEVPSVFARVVLPSGDRVRLAIVHPRPPRPDIQQGSEFRDAELVLAARALDGERGPVLVAGDLNDVAWSRTTRRFQTLSRLLDPRVGRGLFSTFHARYPLLRWPLDHVFHSEALGLVQLRRLGPVGSDHFPMLVEVAVSEVAPQVQDAPEAGADEQEEAREAVETVHEELAREAPADARERDREDV